MIGNLINLVPGPIGDVVVGLIFEFGRAMGVGDEDTAQWIRTRHPELGPALNRMRDARADAIARTE